MASELEEALGAVTAVSGASLIQKYIDPLILQYVRRYAPLQNMLPSKQLVGTNIYNWVTRTALPDGGAVSDGGARPISSSTYTQAPVQVKQYQSVGAVTGFAQQVTGVIDDLRQGEVDGAMKNLLWSVETSLLWANDVATAAVPVATSGGGAVAAGPDMRGLDYQVNTYSGNSQNAIDFGNVTLTLNQLDQIIDMVEQNVSQDIGASDYAFVVSPRVASALNALLVQYQRFDSNGPGANTISAGNRVAMYRDIPIIKSSFLASRAQQFGTVTPSTSTTGGTLAAATYVYQVSAVINRFGEMSASTEVSQVTTGATSTVTLTFATPTGPDANTPILYKVYRGVGAGNEVLIGVVAPVDDLGAAVTSIVDTGAALQVNGRSQTVTGAWPSTYVDANAGVKPKAANAGIGSEEIFLLPTDPNFIRRPYVRDYFSAPLAQTTSAPDVMPFYIASDTALAVRAPKYVGRGSRLTIPNANV